MPTRRDALGLIAITASGTLLRPAELFGQSASASLIDGAKVCRIQPETTEGPFYFDPELSREDITEGLPGAALRVRLQIVDRTCRPIEGARIDIWHCDAIGRYSGYPGQGQADEDLSDRKFLRGTRIVGADGIASFATIYPGWYPGRTPHIHLMAYIGGDEVLTGQMFFPDDVSAEVYARNDAYRGGRQDTFNRNDGIARRAGEAALARLSRPAGRLDAALVIAVDDAG